MVDYNYTYVRRVVYTFFRYLLTNIVDAVKHKKIRLLKRLFTFTAISSVYTTLVNVHFIRKSRIRRYVVMLSTLLFSERYVFYSPNISMRTQLVCSCMLFSWMISSQRSPIRRTSQRGRIKQIRAGVGEIRQRESSIADKEEVPDDDPQSALHDEEKVQFFIAKFMLRKFQGELSVEDLRGLFAHLTHLTISDPIVWTGSPNGMYIIRQGVVGIYKDGKLLTRLTRGESTGDMRVLCPTDDTSYHIQCLVISGPAHVSFISAEDFASYMVDNLETLRIYVSTAIGNYWRLVRFVLCEHLDFSDENLAVDIVHSDIPDLDLPLRRVIENAGITFEPGSALFLATGSCTINGKTVNAPAIVGAASLLARMNPSTVIREFLAGKNCYVVNVKLENLCFFRTLVSLAWIMAQDCDLFLRLGLSRHFVHSGRTLPRECHLLISGRLAAEKINAGTWDDTTDAKCEEIGSVTLVGTEYLYERQCDVRYVALRDCECVRITKESYHAIIEFDASAGQRLAELLHRTQKASAHAVNAAIVGVLFCPEVAPHEVTDVKQLLDSKKSFDAEVVDVQTVRAALGEKHQDTFSAFDDTSYKAEMAAAWLANLEKSVDHLIVLSAHLCSSSECDLAENVFAQFVTTHCDRLLVFCKPNSTTVSSIERRCFARTRYPRTDLVILHESKPEGTRFVLSPRRSYINFHHHVIALDQRDFCRVHRYILGTTTCLILGGGGARGLAHLGVFRALRERNVEIDLIGGTSQGAFMGALLAGYYHDIEAISEAVTQFSTSLSSRLRVFKHGTLPLVSLAHGYKFTEYIRRAMPTLYIEDLHIPFFCTSSNVTTARAVYHHTGLLWKYVRASMTIIGLFPPIWDDGQLLVDGGYLDNLPVLYIRTIVGHESTVIAADVENKDASAFETVSFYEDGLSGLYLFMRRLLTLVFDARPFNHPSQDALSAQLMYAQHIVRLENCLKTGTIDLYIRPPFIDSVWIADYHLFKQMDRRGYLHTRDILEEYLGEEKAAQPLTLAPVTRRLSLMPSSSIRPFSQSISLAPSRPASPKKESKRMVVRNATSEDISHNTSVVPRRKGKGRLARAATGDR